MVSSIPVRVVVNGEKVRRLRCVTDINDKAITKQYPNIAVEPHAHDSLTCLNKDDDEDGEAYVFFHPDGDLYGDFMPGEVEKTSREMEG